MKRIYKPFILLLALVIFVFSLPLSASAEEAPRFGRQVLSGMPGADELVSAYDELKEGCEELLEEFSISAKVTENGIATAMAAFINDYPEYFWVSGGYTVEENTGDDYIDKIKPEYSFKRSKIAAASSALDSMAEKLLEGISGKSDYDKALIIHDRLAERITYKNTDNDQTAYGAIVEGEAVCAGYARAYHYLLNKAGITAWSVAGKSINPTTNTSENHRWNMVKLDGHWYYADVTWDDQPGVTYHNYFLRPYSYFKLTHFLGEFVGYLPEDDGPAIDYFKKNNLIFKNVDTDRLVSLLKKSNNTANIYIDGDVNTFIHNLGGKMETIVKALGAKGGASYTYSTLSLGNEVFLTVIIEQKNHKHSLKKVSGTPATCYQTGIKDYYKCSCGRAFADKDGKTELSDSSSLVLDKIDHTSSDEWRSNLTAHWKYCTVCDADIEGSTSLHTDEDENLVCDICGIESEEPFVQNEGGGTEEDKQKKFPYTPVIIGAVIGIAVISLLIKIFKR